MARAFAKAFYHSSVWKEVRESILKRDNYMCQMAGCHNPAKEVHHKKKLTPDNINDTSVTVNPDNLISLCGECHKAIHVGDKRAGLGTRRRYRTEPALPEIIFDDAGYPVITNSHPPWGTLIFPRSGTVGRPLSCY